MNNHHDAKRRTIKLKLSCEQLDDRTVPAVINPLLGAVGASVPFAVPTPGVSTNAVNTINNPQSPFSSPGGTHGLYITPDGHGGVIYRNPFGPTNPVQNQTPVTTAPTTASGTNAINDINHPQPPFSSPGGTHGVYIAPGGPGSFAFLGGSNLFGNRPTTPTATTTPSYTNNQQNARFTNGSQFLFAQRTLQQFQNQRQITGLNLAQYALQHERLSQRFNQVSMPPARNFQATTPATTTPTSTSGQQNARFTNGSQASFAQRTLQQFQNQRQAPGLNLSQYALQQEQLKQRFNQANRQTTGLNLAQYALQQEQLKQRFNQNTMLPTRNFQATSPTSFAFNGRALGQPF